MGLLASLLSSILNGDHISAILTFTLGLGVAILVVLLVVCAMAVWQGAVIGTPESQDRGHNKAQQYDFGDFHIETTGDSEHDSKPNLQTR